MWFTLRDANPWWGGATAAAANPDTSSDDDNDWETIEKEDAMDDWEVVKDGVVKPSDIDVALEETECAAGILYNQQQPSQTVQASADANPKEQHVIETSDESPSRRSSASNYGPFPWELSHLGIGGVSGVGTHDHVTSETHVDPESDSEVEEEEEDDECDDDATINGDVSVPSMKIAPSVPLQMSFDDEDRNRVLFYTESPCMHLDVDASFFANYMKDDEEEEEEEEEETASEATAKEDEDVDVDEQEVEPELEPEPEQESETPISAPVGIIRKSNSGSAKKNKKNKKNKKQKTSSGAVATASSSPSTTPEASPLLQSATTPSMVPSSIASAAVEPSEPVNVAETASMLVTTALLTMLGGGADESDVKEKDSAKNAKKARQAKLKEAIAQGRFVEKNRAAFRPIAKMMKVPAGKARSGKRGC